LHEKASPEVRGISPLRLQYTNVPNGTQILEVSMQWKKAARIALAVLICAFVAQVSMRIFWPPAEEARARDNTTFRVPVDWDAVQNPEDIDPDLVTIILRTYSETGLVNLIDEEEIPWFFDENERRSIFELSFSPNSQGLYWTITVTINVAAEFEMMEDNPLFCGAFTYYDVNLPPNGAIHMIDL